MAVQSGDCLDDRLVASKDESDETIRRVRPGCESKKAGVGSAGCPWLKTYVLLKEQLRLALSGEYDRHEDELIHDHWHTCWIAYHEHHISEEKSRGKERLWEKTGCVQ